MIKQIICYFLGHKDALIEEGFIDYQERCQACLYKCSRCGEYYSKYRSI